MDIVAEVMLKVNVVFDEKKLEDLARATGFMRRERKVHPKIFLENMIFLRLEQPNSSLEDLVYEFYKNDTRISKQALHKKFAQPAVNFVEAVLNKLLQELVSEHPLSFVNNVRVIDSSEIRLNKVLKDIFPQVRHQGAAVKLQALMDVIGNQIVSLAIRPSKEPDQAYRAYLEHVQAGDLFIGDLGYFCVDSFKQIQAKEGFFLWRYFKNTHIHDLNTRELIDLRGMLKRSKVEQVSLKIGLRVNQFPCQLVAIKLTEKAYQQRLRNLAEKHRKDPRSKATQPDSLNQWTIFVTNLSSSIEVDVLLQVYSLRWQIELLFKMMKTFLNLRSIDAVSQPRALISLYTSLISMTLLSFVANTIIDKEVSLYKASKIFIKNIRTFFGFINSKNCAISWLKEILNQFALKESRPKRPSTRLSLELSYA
jgi:hypothetical protein